jgi:ADP-heptose:LPS heptosyltransferase
MSNILIIKHGSLGDIAQISGVLRDIKENHTNKKTFILTTIPYVELLSKCPYLDGVLIDKRLPRWNIFYLIKLKKMLSKFNFTHVYDLQNSSRTLFYRKLIIKSPIWSSTQTTLENDQKKKDFDEESVLNRFDIQLKKSNIKTKYTLKPNFSWATTDIDSIVKQYFGKKFILLFPFCSPQLQHKKWPYYNQLIKIIRFKHKNLEICIAPGPNELNEAKKIKSVSITMKSKSLNIMQLTGLVKKASFVIANDTGPAHIAAHIGQKGLVIFGHHTTPKKVSIETEKFKAIVTSNLSQLKAEEVYAIIKKDLELIN